MRSAYYHRCSRFIFAFLCALLGIGSGIEVPSGLNLKTVPDEISQFADPENTGSALFKIGSDGVDKTKRLTLHVAVDSFRDKDSLYFRAHPIFLHCLQKAWAELENDERKVTLRSGYKVRAENSIKGNYSRAGTGATLAFASTESSKNFSAMAIAFLRHCPPLFAPLGRDLGLIIETDAIFVFMTGDRVPSQFIISHEGTNSEFEGIPELRAWAAKRLDEVTQPTALHNCSGAFVPAELHIGDVFPSGATIASVGPPDVKIVRTEAEPDRWDFLRLVQFPSDNLAFRSDPREAERCLTSGGILGNGVFTRCGTRLMSPRMFSRMNTLQAMARRVGLQVTVTEGWEAAGGPSLRQEGREVRVTVTGGPSGIARLSSIAVCAEFDFVERQAEGLRLAVVKQYSIGAAAVNFPSAELMPVAAPQRAWKEKYELDADYFDQRDFPLFDSRTNETVADAVPLSLFSSKEEDVRYMRLNPAIVRCYMEILRWENRDRAPSSAIRLRVGLGFISKQEEAAKMNPFLDDRLNTHTLGIAMQLSYEKPNSTFSVWRLAESIASTCPLVFITHEDTAGIGKAIGLGIYSDSVHVDMRSENKIWLQSDDLVPSGRMEAVRSSLATRITQSVQNRIIDPIDFEVACRFDDPPLGQDASFKQTETEMDRRLKSAGDPPECEANAPVSPFCQQSQTHREAVVQKLLEIISYKHMEAEESTVQTALNGCLLECSKCISGTQWRKKVAQCNALLHILPFGPQNNRSDVHSNLYPRDDESAFRRACEAGGHCVDHSPLFGIFEDSLRSRFRPQSNKPTKELVYDPVSNPSPLAVLIRRLYAISARGEVTVWLRSESDVISMASSLKAIFVYNKAVTRVHVRVLDADALPAVVAALEAQLEGWRSSACPRNSRVALTPYVVEEAPEVSRTKREAYEERHLVREQWERWMNDEQRPDRI